MEGVAMAMPKKSRRLSRSKSLIVQEIPVVGRKKEDARAALFSGPPDNAAIIAANVNAVGKNAIDDA